MDFRKRNTCPCCERSILGNEKIIEGNLNHNVKKNFLKNVWMGIGKTEHFSYLKCKNCGTLFNSEYPSDSLINELYSMMPANMEEEVNQEHQIKNQLSYAKKIFKGFKLLKKEADKSSFIEIGADRGLLIKELNKLIGESFIYCAGIEPNNLVKDELEKNLNETSLNYGLFNDIQELEKNNKKFNLAACIHILDHSFEPKKLLSQIRNKLFKNGLLLVVVHNPNSSLAKVLSKKWPAYCPQHPQLFTKKGMMEISKMSGFEIINQGRTVNNFSLSMITSFFGLNLGFAKNINLKLPLGNMYYLLKKF